MYQLQDLRPQICRCRKAGSGKCDKDLIEYLQDNSEYRMSDITVKYTPDYDFA